MNLDELLDRRQAKLARDMRIGRQGPSCLPFSELGAATLRPEAAHHLQACTRCATLRDRLLTAGPLSSDQLAAVETVALQGGGPPRSWRFLGIIVPLAAAACLFGAMMLWPDRPVADAAGCARLRGLVLDSGEQVDHALNLLGSAVRFNDDVDRLKENNAALRAELRGVVTHLEALLAEVRRPAGE